MECPNCDNEIGNARQCPHCSANLDDPSWSVILKVNPPEDMVIVGLLQSLDIPVRMLPHEALGSLFPGNIGPLYSIRVAVPSYLAEKALQLLQAQLVDDEYLEF